ncbi:hypothetical protein ACRAWF_24835 [Streptomyces sp. L7]
MSPPWQDPEDGSPHPGRTGDRRGDFDEVCGDLGRAAFPDRGREVVRASGVTRSHSTALGRARPGRTRPSSRRSP